MIKPIEDFANLLGASVGLNEHLIVKKQNRYFLLNKSLKRLTSKDFFYAGTYLGKVKDGKFFPGFNLLSIIAHEDANKIFVDKKTEWLFICGRDIFGQGITKVAGSMKKGDHVLILNSRGECLGFGKILRNWGRKSGNPVVQNILDIGDFLRRERKQPQ
jgi:ribosome biogenesis protein Nip4